jgi:hypothetical protein
MQRCTVNVSFVDTICGNNVIRILRHVVKHGLDRENADSTRDLYTRTHAVSTDFVLTQAC